MCSLNIGMENVCVHKLQVCIHTYYTTHNGQHTRHTQHPLRDTYYMQHMHIPTFHTTHSHSMPHNTFHRFLNYLDLLKAWPDKCSIHATDSTRALVIAFEKVLMQQYTQRMKVPPKLLAQTILKYQEDILYDMSVAAAQNTRKA